MSKPNSTKWLFARTLRQILLTQSFKQIKITDLCLACGAERQAFYYHFKDKYDLVAWIYEQTFQDILQQSGGLFRFEETVKLLQTFQKGRTFYKKVFEDHSQNSLTDYIQCMNRAYVRKALQQEKQVDILSDEAEFAIRFFVYAWTSCWKEWIIEEPNYTPEEYAKLLYSNSASILTWNTDAVSLL